MHRSWSASKRREFLLQEALSLVYTEGFDFARIARRDGGTDSGGWFGDGFINTAICLARDIQNCTTFCSNRAIYSYMSCDAPFSWPHYIKCYDSNSPNALNDVRLAFPSQEGTTGIDPLLPQISLGNISACLRTFLYFEIIILKYFHFLYQTMRIPT